MIIDPAHIRESATPAASLPEFGYARTRHLSDAGGLTQFGMHEQVLMPGAASSRRHWHSAEDEFVYVLEGAVTLEDDTGLHRMGPGDAAAWPHGAPNAHRLLNQSDAPCRYLIVGSRAAGDVCTYPDAGERQVNHAARWEVVAEDGRVVRAGELPPELMNLRAPWGGPWDGLARPAVLRAGSIPAEACENTYPDAWQDIGLAKVIPLSDAGGLTQFGAFVEMLHPGAQSSLRHWHSAEDEFLFTLAGHVTLHQDDGPTTLPPGTAVAWPAGVANGHCLENRSDRPVTYFLVGSRLAEDEVTYPDHDLHYSRKGGFRTVTRKDGTPYPGWPKETNR